MIPVNGVLILCMHALQNAITNHLGIDLPIEVEPLVIVIAGGGEPDRYFSRIPNDPAIRCLFRPATPSFYVCHGSKTQMCTAGSRQRIIRIDDLPR